MPATTTIQHVRQVMLGVPDEGHGRLGSQRLDTAGKRLTVADKKLGNRYLPPEIRMPWGENSEYM